MIRSLTPSDARAMADLHAESFDQAWSASEMKSHTEKDVALGSGHLDGFILIQMAADQCEILTIAVNAGHRQKGLGYALLSEGEKVAANRGADIIFLEVAEDNRAAIALYRRAGYEAFGRRKAYYKRPGGRVAALVFRKNLRPLA